MCTPLYWAVRKGGGGLPKVTALTAQQITIMYLFVVQVTAGKTHGDTQYIVSKQTNQIFNVTPSGDRNYQLILPAHKRWFLEENKFSFPVIFLITISLAK